MRAFIDTNLWAYRLDQRNPGTSERIRHWLAQVCADHEVVVSTQVLIELRAVVTRKFRPALGEAQTTALLEALCDFEVVTTDATLVLDAHLLSTREQLSWFDALIAEAAIRSRCDVLFSVDFNHGGRIGALRLINPLVDR